MQSRHLGSVAISQKGKKTQTMGIEFLHVISSSMLRQRKRKEAAGEWKEKQM